MRSTALASPKFLLRRALACAKLARETTDDDCRARCLRLEQVYRQLAQSEGGGERAGHDRVARGDGVLTKARLFAGCVDQPGPRSQPQQIPTYLCRDDAAPDRATGVRNGEAPGASATIGCHLAFQRVIVVRSPS